MCENNMRNPIKSVKSRGRQEGDKRAVKRVNMVKIHYMHYGISQ
jgi:hypothetical protein